MQDAKILETLRLLVEELGELPQVSALVLTSLYLHLGEPALTATHEGHRIITRDNGWHRQCTLMVYNPSASQPLKDSLSMRLEQMLRTVVDYSEPYIVS